MKINVVVDVPDKIIGVASGILAERYAVDLTKTKPSQTLNVLSQAIADDLLAGIKHEIVEREIAEIRKEKEAELETS